MLEKKRLILSFILTLLSLACAPYMALAQDEGVKTARQHLAKGDLSAAEKSVDEALKAQPNSIEAHLLKGVLQARQKKLDEAIETFEKLIEAHPGLPQPYNNLAAIHASQGRFEDARETLMQAIKSNPAYPVARENLADLYANMAQAEYQRALMLEDDNRRIRRKGKQISIITGRPFAVPSSKDLEARVDNQTTPSTANPEAQVSTQDKVEPKKPLSSCILVGPIRGQDQLLSASSLLHEQGATTKSVKEDTKIVHHMVYMPLSGDKKAIEALMARLREAGVRDMSVALDKNKNQIISLGIFSKAISVKRRRDELAAKGFDTAVSKRVRTRSLPWVRAEFGDRKPSLNEIRNSLRGPGINIKACP